MLIGTKGFPLGADEANVFSRKSAHRGHIFFPLSVETKAQFRGLIRYCHLRSSTLERLTGIILDAPKTTIEFSIEN